MKRTSSLLLVLAALVACPSMLKADAVSLTFTLRMSCPSFGPNCSFFPGTMGSPEYGTANFDAVAKGWSASFHSDPAIAYGTIDGEYMAFFGAGGAFRLHGPAQLELTGTLVSGLSFVFSPQLSEVVAWFTGHWNDGRRADGDLVFDATQPGNPVTLDVTTATPDPGTLLLVSSGTGALACFRKRRDTRPRQLPYLLNLATATLPNFSR